MKAVVMELREGKAAILDHNGVFHITEDHQYSVGQILEIPDEIPEKQGKIFSFRQQIRRHALPAAAAAALILTTGGGVAAVTVPVSSVTMEMDTKLVYHLNMLDRVLSVDMADSEASPAEQLRPAVKGKRLDEAVGITLDLLSENGEILTTDTPMNVTVESHFGKEGGIEKLLKEEVEVWNSNQDKDALHSVQLIWEPRSEGMAGDPGQSGSVFQDLDSVGGESPGMPGSSQEPAGESSGEYGNGMAYDSQRGEGAEPGPAESRSGLEPEGRSEPSEQGNPPADQGGQDADARQNSEQGDIAEKNDKDPRGGEPSERQENVWSELPGSGNMGENTGSAGVAGMGSGTGEGHASEGYGEAGGAFGNAGFGGTSDGAGPVMEKGEPAPDGAGPAAGGTQGPGSDGSQGPGGFH